MVTKVHAEFIVKALEEFLKRRDELRVAPNAARLARAIEDYSTARAELVRLLTDG